MPRHKTQSNTNRITICVDDVTKNTLRAAAGICQQELLDFVYAAVFDAVLTVAATRKAALPMSISRVQPVGYKQKVKQHDKLRKSG